MALLDLNKELLDLLQSRGNSNKVYMGYTVNLYDGILSLLKSSAGIRNNIREGATSVYGDDTSSLDNMSFVNNFSTNNTAAVWKMELGLFGSLPIEYSNKMYGIIAVEGMDETKLAQTGNTKLLPLTLDANAITELKKGQSFENGVFIDVNSKLVTYLNNFYKGPNTEKEFDEMTVAQLVANRLLMAQICTKNGSMGEALVIGNSGISGSRILITPTLFATSTFASIGFNVSTKDLSGTSLVILPQSGGENKCAITNGTYTTKNGAISGLDVTKFLETWLGRANTAAAETDKLVILQFPAETTVYVKIYIKDKNKALLSNLLPKGVNEDIFLPLNLVVHQQAALPANMSGKLRAMHEAIQQVCSNRGLLLFTPDMIGKKGNRSLAGDGGWVSANGGTKSAMAGSFTIPAGWPMSPINMGYNNRSSNNQFKRGFPGQSSSGNAKDWATASQEGRFDSALSGRLSNQILDGTMSKDWYKKRAEKAEKGDITIRCQLNVQDCFQSLFRDSFSVYLEAASLYNLNRPEEERITVSELMLRCAPCICAINGSAGVHRARWKDGKERQAGHDGGCAIDFDPANNSVGGKGHNAGTPLVKGMSYGYRPFFHFLYVNGGGWGGSYPFCSGSYDAMHIQFGKGKKLKHFVPPTD